MALTVKERGELTATYRFIEVKLMETLAEWVPTTPEMEIKLLYGAHIWDVAQHADALGKKNLRAPVTLQHSMRPAEDYVCFLDELCGAQESSKRLAGFYDVQLLALQARFRNYLNQTDPLMDAPSVRILERIIQDNARMIQESLDLRKQLKMHAIEGEWTADLARKEASIQPWLRPGTDHDRSTGATGGIVSSDLFADGPARDSRFKVVERWVDCSNFPAGHPEGVVEFLHRQMNEEVNGLECSARGLSDFPNEDWNLRMCMARQCWDESRHAKMFRRLLESKRGFVGQYPVLNFQYRIITKARDLCSRMAIQNRSFEAGGIDAIAFSKDVAAKEGDEGLAELYEAQLADEITHVRFANEWIRAAVAKDPRTVLLIGSALNAASKAFVQVMGKEGTEGVNYPADQEGRLEAGFHTGGNSTGIRFSRRPERRLMQNQERLLAVGNLLCADANRIFEMISKHREELQTIDMTLQGGSMCPAIPMGSPIRIQLDYKGTYAPGQVVAFLEDRKIMVHRVFYCGSGAKAKNYVLTHGDALHVPDPPVHMESLLGPVIAFQKDGQWIAPGNPTPVRKIRKRLLSYLRLRCIGVILELNVSAAVWLTRRHEH